MLLKPNETPDMRVGEKRKVSVNLSGAAGINSISSFAVTNDNMTVETVAYSGLTGTFFLTATQAGTHHSKVSATLSSGETVIDYVRTKVRGEPCSSSDDYDR